MTENRGRFSGKPAAYATIEDWARAEPQDAILWALHQPAERRVPSLERVLRATAHRAATAIGIGRALLEAQDPFAPDYGTILVGVLSDAGAFETALQFLSNAPVEYAADWAATAFRRWAADDLPSACAAFDDMVEPTVRAATLKAIVATSAESRPASLARYAQTLTSPTERSYALEEAILGWCLQDPAALAAWLDHQPPSPELDLGLAALATRTDAVNRPPETAVAWAQRIADPQFRAKVLAQMTQPIGFQ